MRWDEDEDSNVTLLNGKNRGMGRTKDDNNDGLNFPQPYGLPLSFFPFVLGFWARG